MGNGQLKLAALALQAPCKERDGEIQRLENAIREAKRALATLSGPFLNWTGKVQMCYIDPPYGVKFGSNFQPFIRKREVKHNEDDDFTREPEMVQAY